MCQLEFVVSDLYSVFPFLASVFNSKPGDPTFTGTKNKPDCKTKTYQKEKDRFNSVYLSTVALRDRNTALLGQHYLRNSVVHTNGCELLTVITPFSIIFDVLTNPPNSIASPLRFHLNPVV